MANTYTSLFYHIVFSTKNRTPYIRPEIQQRVWEYMGGVMRHHKLTALQIGGVDDHAPGQPGGRHNGADHGAADDSAQPDRAIS